MHPASSVRRVVVAVALAYCSLNTMDSAVGLLPGPELVRTVVGWPLEQIEAGIEVLVRWFGQHVLGFTQLTPKPTGSGDTELAYARAATHAVLALVLAMPLLLLPLATRRWRSDLQDVFEGLLSLVLRYHLAMTMLGYGFHKVLPLQFGRMEGSQLLATWGNSSPMNVLWAFMATSPAYTVFSGAMEVLGGSLLLWRRTSAAGALVTFAVMANVALLNYCYGVPVKLFSTHLAAMAAILLVLDARRLAAVLVGTGAAPAAAPRWPQPVRGRVWWGLAKLIVVGNLYWSAFAGNWDAWQKTNDPAKQSPLQAIWVVESYTHGDSDQPTAWRTLVVERSNYATVYQADGATRIGNFQVDQDAHTVVWAPLTRQGEKSVAPTTLRYEQREAGTQPPPTPQPEDRMLAERPPFAARRLVLDGELDGRALHIELRERDPDSFLVRGRGFRWIQEYPLNWRR